MMAADANSEPNMSIQVASSFSGGLSLPGLPKRPSRNRTMICSASWVWSPAHARDDTLHLDFTKTLWLLWLEVKDFGDGETYWWVVGAQQKNETEAMTAAKRLLFGFWRTEAQEGDLEPWQSASSDLLSASELNELAYDIWGYAHPS